MISTLGKNIKRLRVEQHIGVSKLAKLACVGIATISQIESGNRQTLQGNTIEKIAKALKVTPNQLMNDTQKKSTSEEELLDVYISRLSKIREQLMKEGIPTQELKSSLLSETLEFLVEVNTL